MSIPRGKTATAKIL
jgi:hypothetical protein